MGKGRASIFEDTDDASIDLSGFTPKAIAATPPPTREQVKAVSEAVNFPSREVAKTQSKARRKPRVHRTGRNVQFNAKALQTTIDRFYALCDKTGWVMGETLERAVTALERELESQK